MNKRTGLSKTASQNVQRHYNVFPYPNPNEIVIGGTSDCALQKLNYAIKSRPNNSLKAKMRIWVPGCGTVQAVETALKYPKAEILGTDISDAAIAAANGFAKSLGVKNLKLKKQDILHSEFKNKFDLVICTGVIHHLQDPKLGLVKIRQAMKRSGVAFLMLYNSHHRRTSNLFQSMIREFLPRNASEKEKWNLVQQLAFTVFAQDHPPTRTQENLRTVMSQGSEVIADTLMHPQEVSYSVEQMFALLDEVDLKFVNWCHPWLWDLQRYISDLASDKALANIDEVKKYQIVQDLLDDRSPAFFFYVARDKRRRTTSYSMQEFMKLKPLKIETIRQIELANFKVLSKRKLRSSRIQGKKWVVNLSVLPFREQPMVYPQIFKRVFEACDGKTSIQEIGRRFQGKIEQSELLEFFEVLLNRFPGATVDCKALTVASKHSHINRS